MPDEPTLDSALTDVRKAYRLLWCYQKRVFDIVKLIAAEFDDMAFYNWRTLHAGSPSRSDSNPMSGRSTWEMLPMVSASYLFLPGGTNHNATVTGQWMLEVLVESDRGFLDTEDGSEPDPASFEPAEKVESTISIFAWYCRGETSKNWVGGVWKVLPWPEGDSVKIDHADQPFTTFRRDFNLAALPDKDAVRAAVASFQATANEALGVSLA